MITPTHLSNPIKLRIIPQKSHWNPPGERNQYIETYVKTARGHLNKLILDNHHHSNKDNLHGNKRKAIKTPRSSNDVIINTADKGGTITIMDTVDFVAHNESQLTNTASYEKLPHKPTALFKSELIEIINHLN